MSAYFDISYLQKFCWYAPQGQLFTIVSGELADPAPQGLRAVYWGLQSRESRGAGRRMQMVAVESIRYLSLRLQIVRSHRLIIID